MMTPRIIRPISSRSPFVPGALSPEPFTLIIFGATGDLASRKLFPALFGLWQGEYLPETCAMVGVARREKSDDAYRLDVKKGIAEHQTDVNHSSEVCESFLGRVYYRQMDFASTAGFAELGRQIQMLEADLNLPGNRLFYLATGSEFFAAIVEGLNSAGLVHREEERPWSRVVLEKPFGHDLASAAELDRSILRFLREDQIYRIDHYLGKETVQNLLAFRFGNAIFEPLFNRNLIDHVRITVAETVGMEGRRGPYYDRAGALRDMVQNHLLQLLALLAMDPPATLKARDISEAKLKVLRNLVPLQGAQMESCVVRGQYGPGNIEGKTIRGYREEEGVGATSTTETFVALRVAIENWRWAGVPFLLKTGKCLPQRVTEIAVQFSLPPLRLFQTVECAGDFCDLTEAKPSVLIFRIQPDEGIRLSFSIKRPGMQFVLEPVEFDFDYGESFQSRLPEAYERLLLDALRGDATLFTRSEEQEAAWEFITPILETWQTQPPPEFPNYSAGTWGPAGAKKLTRGCLGGWGPSGSAEQ